MSYQFPWLPLGTSNIAEKNSWIQLHRDAPTRQLFSSRQPQFLTPKVQFLPELPNMRCVASHLGSSVTRRLAWSRRDAYHSESSFAPRTQGLSWFECSKTVSLWCSRYQLNNHWRLGSWAFQVRQAAYLYLFTLLRILSFRIEVAPGQIVSAGRMSCQDHPWLRVLQCCPYIIQWILYLVHPWVYRFLLQIP